MATLKGQNFRVGIEGTGSDYYVVAMATNCTINLQTNTEDSATKDDAGMASKPVINTKSWSVQVESLNVADVAALLTAIKNNTKFALIWDETATTDNFTSQIASFARKGYAYLNDATFTFDDRTNSVKQLQFTGVGALSAIASSDIMNGPAYDAYTKGQFVRLFLSSNNTVPSDVVAAAKQLSLHVSVSLEDATTKDTDGTWTIQEPTEISYDITSNALVRSGDTITSAVGGKSLADLETIYDNATMVKWQIANTSGANNRTKNAVIVSGTAILSSLSINAAVKQNATYTATLTGYGAYTVGA
jgi:predicted secreted protein